MKRAPTARRRCSISSLSDSWEDGGQHKLAKTLRQSRMLDFLLSDTRATETFRLSTATEQRAKNSHKVCDKKKSAGEKIALGGAGTRAPHQGIQLQLKEQDSDAFGPGIRRSPDCEKEGGKPTDPRSQAKERAGEERANRRRRVSFLNPYVDPEPS